MLEMLELHLNLFNISINMYRNYLLNGVQFTAELPDGPFDAKLDMILVVCCLNRLVCDLSLCTRLLF